MTPIEDILTKNDLCALVGTASELAYRIDLNELLQLILTKAGELTTSPDGAVILYNKDRNSLYFAGAVGDNASLLINQYGEHSQLQIPILGSKAGSVFLSKESLVVDYLLDDPEHFKGVDKETRQRSNSMLCVPLIVDNNCIGVMQLLNKNSGTYNLRDKTLLEEFAKYAAIALRNAHLFEKLIAHMGLYASPQFNGGIEELLKQLNSPARTEKLTVLFADMRGFRLLCQVINNPERIFSIVNQFITMLSNQVLQSGGIVNKFLGDGILALFRYEYHAQRAVNCAFNMLNEFDKLLAMWDQESTEQLNFLDIGIGITTDTVIIGAVGSDKVHDFTVIGTAVNLAAAFEKAARSGKRILVDHLTYTAAKESVAEIEGPVNYELRQPDQRSGNIYKQYHLKKKSNNRIFISHNTHDGQFIENELIPLLEKSGLDCWYSKKDIKPGESWVQSINNGLNITRSVLVIISRNSLNSEWVKEEINMAASRKSLMHQIIPVILDDTKPEDVHPFLQHKQAINLANGDKTLSKLIEVLK